MLTMIISCTWQNFTIKGFAELCLINIWMLLNENGVEHDLRQISLKLL